MRVLHILNGAIGGAATSTRELIEELSPMGVESSIYLYDRATDGADHLRGAVDGRLVTGPLRLWTRRARKSRWKRAAIKAYEAGYSGLGERPVRAVMAACQAFEVDLIHSATVVSPDGARAAARLHRPHVWHVRELVGPGCPHRLRGDTTRAAGQRLKEAGPVIANSRTTAALLFAADDPDVTVIPNGVRTKDLLRLATPRFDGEVTFGMVGHLNAEWKRHDAFIDAASLVAAEHRRGRFTIIGNDPSGDGAHPGHAYARALHDRAEAPSLHGRLTFAGAATSPLEAMSQIDVLVHPATGESFGRVYIEALAAGRPVIAAADGAAVEILRGIDHAAVVDPSAESLASAMRLFLMGKVRGLEPDERCRVARRFDPAASALRVRHVYSAAAH